MRSVVQLILVGVLCLPGCAVDSGDEPAPQHNVDLSFEPVGRFVRTDRGLGYRAYSIETDSGTQYLFDDEFRAPDRPFGPVPVDCVKTKQLGVWLRPIPSDKADGGLEREITIYSKIPRVEVQWTHSARPDGDSRYRHYQVVNFGYRFIVRYLLTKNDKIDGVMKLEISHGDDVLYNTSFELLGCDAR